MQRRYRLISSYICRIYKVCKVRYGMVVIERCVAQLLEQTTLQFDAYRLQRNDCYGIAVVERFAEPVQPALLLFLDLMRCLIYRFLEESWRGRGSF